MSAARPTSEEAVAKALASGTEMTGAAIATATGLGRSTVGKALPALERDGTVRRHPGGRDGRRRLPDRWSIGRAAERDDRARAATQRLRHGQLDGLVLDYVDSQGAIEGPLIQLEEQPPDNRPGAILMGATPLLRDVAHEGAREPLERLHDAHERYEEHVTSHSRDTLRGAAETAKAWVTTLTEVEQVDLGGDA